MDTSLKTPTNYDQESGKGIYNIDKPELTLGLAVSNMHKTSRTYHPVLLDIQFLKH